MLRGPAVWVAASLLLTPCAAKERLGFRHVALDLPGPPSKIVPTDLDGDGRDDLLLVVAYTEIGQTTEDRFENLVQFTTVIPRAFDRREMRAYLATDDGYAPAGAPLRLPPSVLHLEAGPPGADVVALTDEGLSRVRFDPAPGGSRLSLDPVIARPSVLTGTQSFFASLSLVHDLNGDGIVDVLLPAPGELLVYLGTESGLTPRPVDRIEIPSHDDRVRATPILWYPTPTVRDVNGDGIADLLFGGRFRRESRARHHVLLGSPEGRFRPLRAEPLDCHDTLTDLRLAVEDPEAYPWPRSLATLRDLDGDGRAEAVFTEERPRGESLRKELKDAKKPIHLYEFHRLNEDLAIELEPYHTLRVVGHAVEEGIDVGDDFPFMVQQFQDLDDDGREDLVTITLDFSIFQALKILATKRIGIGLDFHVYAQQEDGSFTEVPRLDLSEKLKFDLDNLEVGRFAQFAGDFDGDGRQDFAHLGRGTTVTLHSGRPGCRYPRDPDLAIRIEEPPGSLDLVRIEDLDGDGRSDIRITRPLPDDDPDATAPVRLDLYLSGSGS